MKHEVVVAHVKGTNSFCTDVIGVTKNLIYVSFKLNGIVFRTVADVCSKISFCNSSKRFAICHLKFPTDLATVPFNAENGELGSEPVKTGVEFGGKVG